MKPCMNNFLRKLNAEWPLAAQAHIARHLIDFVKASLYISLLALTSSRPRWLSHFSLTVSHRPSLTSSKLQGRQLLTASASPRNANLKLLVNGCVWKYCLVGKRRAVVQWKFSFLWRRQYSTFDRPIQVRTQESNNIWSPFETPYNHCPFKVFRFSTRHLISRDDLHLESLVVGHTASDHISPLLYKLQVETTNDLDDNCQLHI